MEKITLYHGSPNKEFTPTYGQGEDKHDYGRGFYLTEVLDLAKEWSVCKPVDTQGYVHTYELELDNLKILDFENYDVLCWLAELMKHRDGDSSKRYQILSKKFIDKYGINTDEYDVIKGWRADSSYFYIAKEFVRDNVDVSILKDLLRLGDLGIQYCLKSENAFSQLHELKDKLIVVNFEEFNSKYNERDTNARNKMRELINSDANKIENVFSTLL